MSADHSLEAARARDAADPAAARRGQFRFPRRPDGGEQLFVGQPFTLSRTRNTIAATPPELGQHTEEVLKEFGFSGGDIAALRAAKAV